MRLTAAAQSSAGPRPTNQDTWLIDLELGLLVVADGMGGHNSGEVASRMAVEAVAEFVRATHQSQDLTWPFPYDPEQSRGANRLLVALRVANRQVHEAGKQNPQHTGMGTTIVAGLADGSRLIVGHVGDSRAYCLRASRLEPVTRDHTWLNALVAAGAASGAADHPMRHVLTSGIGLRPDVKPTLSDAVLDAGAHWLFCTDGVHGSVDEPALRRALGAPSADAAARQVVDAALSAGTSDNATAVVLYVD